MECLFDHHPIRVPIAGTRESISHITADTLYACHKAFYTPSNMVLTVAGNVDAQRVIETCLLYTSGVKSVKTFYNTHTAIFHGKE